MWLMVWDVSFQELASKEINIKTVNNNMYLLKSAVFSDQNSDENSERILCQLHTYSSQHKQITMKFFQNISIILMGILVGKAVDFAKNGTKAGLELHLNLFPLPFLSERAFASCFFYKGGSISESIIFFVLTSSTYLKVAKSLCSTFPLFVEKLMMFSL